MDKKENKGIMPPLSGSFEEVTKKIVLPMSNQTEKLQKALLEGTLPIGDITLDCAVLDNGVRVLSERAVHRAFKSKRGGAHWRRVRENSDGANLPSFLSARNIIPFISNELRMALSSPVKYVSMTGKTSAKGINADLIPDICNVWLEARRAGVLLPSQAHLAIQAEILMTAFAKVGIAALIDEATGFQSHRKKDALRLLVAHYLAQGLQKWAKMFHDDFFEKLDTLYGNEKTEPNKRPQYYGKFINNYIYNPLENGYVKAELNKRNITDEGKRTARFHQWLSQEGKNTLLNRIGFITGLMTASNDNLDTFKRLAAPHLKVSVSPDLLREIESSEEEKE